MVQDVALYLGNIFAEAFEKFKNLPWPPTDDFLRQYDILPTQLKSFLNSILAGRAEDCELSRTGHLQSSQWGNREGLFCLLSVVLLRQKK